MININTDTLGVFTIADEKVDIYDWEMRIKKSMICPIGIYAGDHITQDELDYSRSGFGNRNKSSGIKTVELYRLSGTEVMAQVCAIEKVSIVDVVSSLGLNLVTMSPHWLWLKKV